MRDMEEKQELMASKESGSLLNKWLKVLYYAEIASLATILLVLIPALEGISTWIGRITSAVVMVALYQLSVFHERYQKAFLYFAIAFVGGLFQSFSGSNILTSAASICGLVATYQEYHAHSEVINVRDTYLADRWTSLFYWELVAGAVGGFVAVAVVVLGVNSGISEEVLVVLGVAAVAVVEVPLSLLRLKYLKKMMKLFET